MKERQEHGKEIDLKELKILQMDVLEAIDEYCSSNNIRYSLACGTLLGAVRHKGYIPWDDDIDIYILRDEYNKLIADFPTTFKDHYKIASLERDDFYEKPYAKAYDDRTILIEHTNQKKSIGINIDIFPIDDVPDEDELWEKYNKRRWHKMRLFSMKSTKISRQRNWVKNLSLVLLHLSTIFYATRKWALRMDKIAQQNNNKGYSRCFECSSGLCQNKPFPKYLFDDITEIIFENRKYKAFTDTDCYLRNGFGNYMELPPVEKRVSHHDFKAYWK